MSNLLDFAGDGLQVFIFIAVIIGFFMSSTRKKANKKNKTHHKKTIFDQASQYIEKSRSAGNKHRSTTQKRNHQTKVVKKAPSRKQAKPINQTNSTINIKNHDTFETRKKKHTMRQNIGSPESLKKAIILKEILDKPVSLRK